MQGLGTPLWVQFRQFTDDDAEIEAMVATYRAYNLAHHDEMVRPYDGVVDAVRALERRGKTLGLVTSKMRSGAVRGLRIAGLEDAFTVIVGSDEVTRPKPHPEPVLPALARLGSPARDAGFLGEPGALQPVRIGRPPPLDPGAPPARGGLRRAAARRATRLQSVERHGPPAGPHRRAVPGRLPGPDPRHHR